MIKTRKKLIEVSLPLEAINKASAREKSIRHGHPSTLHLWWARRPLAAARAVIFAQMVDDPSEYVEELRRDAKLARTAERELAKRRQAWTQVRDTCVKATGSGLDVPEPGPEPTLDDTLADLERNRLFAIIERMVPWEATTNEGILREAREEIWRGWRRTCLDNIEHPRAAELFDRQKLPAFHDPFAGGGALPLEAQRLGLEAHASDLNPVAVLINKAMIEIPPKFAGKPPVNPDSRLGDQHKGVTWRGAQGLAQDVRYYGQWMRDQAEQRIGHLYPRVAVTPQMVAERPDLEQYQGRELTVIAWLWARTVKSPNPAFAGVEVPLASTFMLSTRAGKEAYVEPVIEGKSYRFAVKVGKPKDAEAAKRGTKLSRGANFQCLMSGVPIEPDYVKGEGTAGRMGTRLMAIVAEGDRGRVYLAPDESHAACAARAVPEWRPEQSLPDDPRNFWTVQYGLKTFADLFTPRQLVALTTFSDLVGEAREQARRDALAAGLPDDGIPLGDGGTGATAYGEAVGVYLGMGVSKCADRGSSVCSWDVSRDSLRNTFSRQAIPMTWDYAESSLIGNSAGSFTGALEQAGRVLSLAGYGGGIGKSLQLDAQSQSLSTSRVISTDPPYYDNIGYADLSDFFYVWLRRSLQSTIPELFSTVAVPKAEELVATPYRHGGRAEAEAFFLDGMTAAIHNLASQAHPSFPVTIYYAFKQSETQTEAGTSSTGWETFLEAVLKAGFALTGTWPMRTELGNRMIGSGTNALASSIVLVCRRRPEDAPTATRREFLGALKAELPAALREMQRGNIAPVDLAQASIGPGMAVFTRYAQVLDAEGKPLSVREALALINQVLDEALAEREGDFDADARWALAWFESFGFDAGEFGVAETLSRAKNTSVAGVVEAGLAESGQGRVRLLKPEELPADWDPATDQRLSVWEMVHHLIRVLESGGESAAAELYGRIGARAETARDLAYRLYSICERKKWAAEARPYNGLVQSWPEIVRLSREVPPPAAPVQGELL